MEWIEIRARTLEDAIERALDALGVHESELEYDVLVEPKRGMLGLGRSDAQIRARVKPLSREKPQERRRRRGRDEGGGRPQKSQDSGRAKSSSKSSSKQSGSSQRRSPSKSAALTASAAAADPEAAPPPSPPDAGAPDAPHADGEALRPRRRRRGGRGRGRSGGPDRDPYLSSSEEPTMTPDPIELERAATLTRSFMTGLLEAFELPGEVEIVTTESAVDCALAGEQLAPLVGGQGATLAAIEELLRDAVGHQTPGVRLHLDVGGYRARRRAALGEFATRVAGEVAASGVAKALEPMGAADRKVVHDAVAEIEGVTTVSEGDEPRRRVVIQPA